MTGKTGDGFPAPKRGLCGALALALGALLLCACFPGPQGAPSGIVGEGALLSVTRRRHASGGHLPDITLETITLGADETLRYTLRRMYDDAGRPYAEGEAPVLETREMAVGPTPMHNLASRVEEADFFSLPSTLDTGVLDGTMVEITIETPGRAHTVAGINPEEYSQADFRRFYMALDILFSMVVPKEDAPASTQEAGDPGETPLPPGPAGQPENRTGNTPANLANGGALLEAGGKVYLRLYLEGESRIFEVAENGDLERADIPGMQALDGWFYYPPAGNSAAYENGVRLLRAKEDGSGETAVSSGMRVWNFQVAGEYVYFLEPYDGKSYRPIHALYRVAATGGGARPVTGMNVDAYSATANYLALLGPEVEGIVFICTANGAQSIVEARMYDNSFFVDGDMLYYMNEPPGTDQTETRGRAGSLERRTLNGAPEVIAPRATGGFNLDEAWYYYNRPVDSGPLAGGAIQSELVRKNIQSGEVQVLDGRAAERASLCVAGNWLLFATRSRDGESGAVAETALYLMPKTGGAPTYVDTRSLFGA